MAGSYTIFNDMCLHVKEWSATNTIGWLLF